MSNPWFRFYHEWDSDPKVQMMSEAMQRRLAMLFCWKCRGETFHETRAAFHWRVSETDMAETKALFLQNGFIDEKWNLLNWNRRQFLSDSSTDRVRRFRQGKKHDETLHETKGNVTVTGSSVSVSVSESVSGFPEGEKIPSHDTCDTRILSESVGIFGMRQQADMNRLLAVHMKESGRTVDQAITHMIGRWELYKSLLGSLEWQYGSSYKFFTGDFWDNPDGWPRAGVSRRDREREAALKKFREKGDADEAE